MTSRVNKESEMIRKLREYFATTPRSQVLKDWEEVKAFDFVGPTVEEFMSWNRIVPEPRKSTLRVQSLTVEPVKIINLSAEKYNSHTALYMCC
jgi:hypothetical protein